MARVHDMASIPGVLIVLNEEFPFLLPATFHSFKCAFSMYGKGMVSKLGHDNLTNHLGNASQK